MNEDYMQSSELPSDINLEGLNEQEARAIKEALSRFMRSYQEKPEEQGDEAWLTQRFQEELPNLTVEQAQALSRETLEEIHQYDKNLASLKEARAKGQTTEEWFAEKSTEAASGLSTNAFGQRVAELDTALSQANAQMARVITTQSGLSTSSGIWMGSWRNSTMSIRSIWLRKPVPPRSGLRSVCRVLGRPMARTPLMWSSGTKVAISSTSISVSTEQTQRPPSR